jgi:hypothetical protein
MRRIALLLLVFLPPLPARAADLLLLRAGGERHGQLQSCVAEQCRLSGDSIARAAIAWIGFADPQPPPPGVADPARDAVFLVDDTVLTGHVVAITLGDVAMDETSVERAKVRWVWFAGAPIAGVQPPSSATPTPTPSGPGFFWIGRITGHYTGTVDGITSRFDVTVDARLREVQKSALLLPDPRGGRRVGTMIRLEPEGTIVQAQVQASGPGLSCNGGGSITVTASQDDAHAHPSVIYVKSVEVDTTPILGFDVPLGAASLYQVGISSAPGEEIVYTCMSGGTSSEARSGYLIPMLGRTPLLSAGPMVDPSLRYLEDGGSTMRGSYTTAATGAYEKLEATWELTRSVVH